SPDPVLYFVRGFDPSTRRFAYAVNPQFGKDRASIARLISPFRLSIDFSVDVGTPIRRQQFNSWVLPGRAGNGGNRLSEAELHTRFTTQALDIYQLVLRETDSLLLSRS